MRTYKPIIFQPDMVRATIAETKTVTRRVMKPQVPPEWDERELWVDAEGWIHTGTGGSYLGTKTDSRCPYGGPGGQLWVRENILLLEATRGASYTVKVMYMANKEEIIFHNITPDQYSWALRKIEKGKITPSIYMPEWLARLRLTILEIKIQRTSWITDEGALAEGTEVAPGQRPRAAFIELWDSINKDRGFPFSADPWVYKIKYEIESRRIGP